jgi:hypothetical protein
MKAAFLLAPDRGGWRVARIDGGQAQWAQVAAGEGAVQAVRQKLRDMGYRGAGVCLALESRAVYPVLIECDGLPRQIGRASCRERVLSCV